MPAPKDILLSLQGKNNRITKVCGTSKRKPIPDDTVEISTKGLFLSLKKTHKVIVFPNVIKILPKHITSSSSSSSSINPIFFDLDHTLIKTKSGRKFSNLINDWEWLNFKIIPNLQKLSKLGIPIIVISNQGTVSATHSDSKSLNNIITKISCIFKELIKMNININLFYFYCSTNKKGKMRKPEIGIFQEFQKDSNLNKFIPNECIFVGDAAGRKDDFSDSDLKFAKACGLQFKTPEEYFS